MPPSDEQQPIGDAVNQMNQLAVEGQHLLSRLSEAPCIVHALSVGAAATNGSNPGPRSTNSSSSSISESIRNFSRPLGADPVQQGGVLFVYFKVNCYKL